MDVTCETTHFLSACYVPNVQHTTVSVLGDFLAGKATVLPNTLCDTGVPRKEEKEQTHTPSDKGREVLGAL